MVWIFFVKPCWYVGFQILPKLTRIFNQNLNFILDYDYVPYLRHTENVSFLPDQILSNHEFYVLVYFSHSNFGHNPFHASGPFLHPLKTSENQRFWA